MDLTCWSCARVSVPGAEECTAGLPMPRHAGNCPAFLYEPGTDEAERSAETTTTTTTTATTATTTATEESLP